jgi:AraC family transcriptional regulator
LVVKGGYSESCGSSAVYCRRPTLVLQPPEQAHCDQICSDGAEDLIVEIMPDRLADIKRALPIFRQPAYFDEGPALALARRLHRQFLRTDAASCLAVEGLVLEVLAEVARKRSDEFSGAAPAWLRRVCDLLHDCVAEQLSLETLARDAGVHPTHLCRAFRKHFQSSIGEYVRRLRVRKAGEELTRTTHPIAQIAQTTGFYDQAHLNRAFRNHFGMTPGEFRCTAQRR